MGVAKDIQTAIRTITEQAIIDAPFDKTRRGVVRGINEDNNTYTVHVDGMTYDGVKSTNGSAVHVGDVVDVTYPTNNTSQMVISGITDMTAQEIADFVASIGTQGSDVYHNETVTKGDLKTILQELGIPYTPLDYYPVGAYFETSDSTFDPNTVWGGTWASESDSYVEDITTRTVSGTIGRNFGNSAALSAPNVTGYTFVMWVNALSNGWVGSIYTANPTSQTGASFFVSTYATPGGTGSFASTALYKKVVTKYRWHRTA